MPIIISVYNQNLYTYMRISGFKYRCTCRQVLNLFLALLIASFGTDNLPEGEEEAAAPNKLQEAISRFSR